MTAATASGSGRVERPGERTGAWRERVGRVADWSRARRRDRRTRKREVYQTRACPLCTALDGPRAQQDTLALAGNQLNEQQRNALQLQIAQLQDSTERYKVGEGGRQFDAELAEKIRQSGLDEAYRNASLGASSGASSASNSLAQQRLDQDQRQFDASLQFQKDQWLTAQNQNPVLTWLQQAFGGV